MCSDDSNARQLSRREVIRLAGLGGLAVAAVGWTGPQILTAPLVGAAEATPEAFLTTLFAQRAQAMSTGDALPLDALYDPTNPTLRSFERERARFFKNGLAAIWGNSTVLDYRSVPKLIALEVTGSTAVARIEEAFYMDWLQRPEPLSAAAEVLRRQNPEQYAPGPRGARGEITSGFMTKHEITLVKGSRGWNLAKDAYDEFHLFAASPDLQPGSWAALPRRGGPDVPAGTPPTMGIKTEPMVSAMATYNRDLAVQCAANNWGPYSSNYNPDYYDFSPDPCGGDCTNYVSQCLRSGGMQSDGTWGTVGWGSCMGCGCCKSSARYAGTVAWIRNTSLNLWLNDWSSPRRGQPLPADPGTCWKGDIINYDWAGTDPSVTDHVTLVVEAGGAPLVASHTPNAWRADYRLGRGVNYCQYTRIVSAG